MFNKRGAKFLRNTEIAAELGMTTNALARHLARFGIKSRQLWVDGHNHRVYYNPNF
jgi:hypothetical protein